MVDSVWAAAADKGLQEGRGINTKCTLSSERVKPTLQDNLFKHEMRTHLRKLSHETLSSYSFLSPGLATMTVRSKHLLPKRGDLTVRSRTCLRSRTYWPASVISALHTVRQPMQRGHLARSCEAS